MQVGFREFLDELEETVGFVELLDLLIETEVLEQRAGLGREGVNVMKQILAEAFRVVEELRTGSDERVSIYQAWALSAVIFASIWTWSYLWLSHFRYGPLEWLWRPLTLGKFPLNASPLQPGETPVSAA